MTDDEFWANREKSETDHIHEMLNLDEFGNPLSSELESVRRNIEETFKENGIEIPSLVQEGLERMTEQGFNRIIEKM